MDPSKIVGRSNSSKPVFSRGHRTTFLAVVSSCFLSGFALISDTIGAERITDELPAQTQQDSARHTELPASSPTANERDLISRTKLGSNEAFQDQGNPAPDRSPAIAATSRRLFQTTPASKMTIRRDPLKNRFLGGDDASGIAMRTLQEELNKADKEHNSGQLLPTFASSDWPFDDQYGKYLYISHAPLLFEDIPAERYGEVCSPCFQPVVGFAKFMGTVPLLPYKIATNYYAANHEDGVCAFDHQGNLRPGILEGSYFPTREAFADYPHSNVVGGLTQAATVTGLIFLLP